ncbi:MULTISPECIES: hypothetical protein [unclassified Frankia]|uniref:hypothetical protein n=2 Tax=Frankia TaxID=1854 RepID=UPI002AD4ED3B|nr:MULTISPECIES: hypothetical protein [unclassified Frankia]
MAMNLRLNADTEIALRACAEQTGRSQQEIVRDAVDRYLNAANVERHLPRDRRIDSGTLLPPRTPYRRTTPTLTVPDGTTTLDLLDRSDRI